MISGKGIIMCALIEIQDAVVTTIRRGIGLNLVGLEIYFADSGRDGKVIVVGRGGI